MFSLREPDTVTYALMLLSCEHLCLNTGVSVMQEVEFACLTAEFCTRQSIADILGCQQVDVQIYSFGLCAYRNDSKSAN